jgi:hypothetical protein
MTDTQLQRMAEAAAVIRRVVGHEFRWLPWVLISSWSVRNERVDIR